MTSNIYRYPDRFSDSHSERGSVEGSINRRLNYGEFVATQAGYGVNISDTAQQSVGNGFD
jgi:hypothetical protein